MHLVDSFMPVIAYLVGLRSSVAQAQPEYQQVRADIGRLISESEASCRNGGIDAQHYDQGRFAVCAWIDEALLASDWSHRQLWQREQLQRLFYNTTEAGVEVFERLEALGAQREVREVYSLCLALGFKGRYIGEGDAILLEQVKSANLKLLLAEEGGLNCLENTELCPGALAVSPSPVDGNPDTAPFAMAPLTLMLASAPLILFGVLYLVYRYLLNGLVLQIL